MSIQLSAEELYFIDTYVFPNRRERLKYELETESASPQHEYLYLQK